MALEAIAVAVGQDGVKAALGVIRRHVQYYTSYTENVEQLESQMDDLKAKRKDLQDKVDAARRTQDKPFEQVLRWLKNSEDVISECEQLQEQIGKNSGRHYRLGRKVVKMMETIKELNENCNFDTTTVACNPPPPRVEITATEYVEGLDTMEEAKNQVMDALRDVGVSVIGVCGMGGIGKTTLMQRVNNELEESPDLFKTVIMVTVSSTPDIKKLQDQIAERLGLQLDKNKEVSFRAHKLSERLEKEGSVLIILDDVWEMLETDQVGVTCGSGSRCCKIVLTTRDKDVCRNAQRSIHMCGLTEKESWKLFRLKAGEVVDRDEIESIAEEVCKECAQLPLAISAVASSLENEDRDFMWRVHLDYLKNSEPAKIRGLTEKVTNPLRLSYDLLHTKELKLCFLTCSLFPEDHVIDVVDLVYYGIGEGFLKGGNQHTTLLDDCLYLVDTLKSRGLLLDRGGEATRMHDVVRDVAISIATKDDTYGFYVKAGVGHETEWPGEAELQGRKRLSFTNSHLQYLPPEPRCDRKIESLLLRNSVHQKAIPDGFFENMRDLLILDLRETKISTPPLSLRCLEKLRVFLISYFTISPIDKSPHLDVTNLLELKNLVALSLENFQIVELPEEIGELVLLKILDLTSTRIRIIKPNVLSRLSRLEELYLGNSFNRWEACNDATGEASTHAQHDRKLASFSELGSLKKLKAIVVQVENAEIFSQDMTPGFLERLSRFHVSVIQHGSSRPGSLLIRLDLSCPTPMARWVEILMTKAVDLCFHECQVHTALRNSTFQQQQPFSSLRVLQIHYCNKMVVVSVLTLFLVMPNLEDLGVEECDTLKDVFQYSPTREAVRFAKQPEQQQGITAALCPSLSHIVLAGLPQLQNIVSCTEEKITSSPLPAGSFQNLRTIGFVRCASLRHLFSWSMAMCLVQLEVLKADQCIALKEIISGRGYDDNVHVFPKLKDLRLKSLPKLEGMSLQQPLEILFLLECPMLKSSFLCGLSVSKLRYFRVTEEWFETLEWEDEHMKNKWKNKVISWS